MAASRFEYFSTHLSSFKSSPAPLAILKTHLPSTFLPLPSSPLPPTCLIILDSSFNPPTTAHISLATSALRRLRNLTAATAPSHPVMTAVLLLLAVKNADKGEVPAALPERLCMIEGAATAAEGGILGEEGCCRVDVGVTKCAYFMEKEEAIRGMYGEVEQVFLVGTDTLERLFMEKYYGGRMKEVLRGFFGGARLVVTEREGGEGVVEGVRRVARELGREEWLERVEVVKGEGMEGVSSTEVRRRAKRGEWDGVEEMVGKKVMEWIEERGLYKD